MGTGHVVRIKRLRGRLLAGLAIASIATAATWGPVLQPTAVRAAAPTPVAEWTFDEGSAATAHDSIGALDGSLSGGATWDSSSAAQGTSSMEFDGVDGMVTIPTGPALEPSGGFTVAFWVRGSPAEPQVFPIIQKGFYDCDTGGSWGVSQVQNGLHGSTDLVTYGYSVPAIAPEVPTWDGAWHVAALVVEPSAGRATMWLDGHKNVMTWPAPDTIQYGPSGRTDTALRLGSPGVACAHRLPFKGAIDDLRIYGSALSDADVLAMSPTWSTTTTVDLFNTKDTNEDAKISAAYTDDTLLYRAYVRPGPGVVKDITWWRSKDGGPDEVFGTTPLIIQSADGFAFFTQQPGTLEPGSYLIHATWPGTPNWGPSTSASLPLEITRRPVQMTLAAAPDTDIPGGSSTLTARLSVEDPPHSYAIPGSIEFHETTGGGDTLLGTGSLSYVGGVGNWNQATFSLSNLGDGTHTYEARFAGTSDLAPASASATVAIGPQVSGVYMTIAPNPALTTEHATASVSVVTYRDAPLPTGTLTLKLAPAGTVLGTTPVNGAGPYSFVLPTFSAGSQGIVAEYSGDVNFAASSSLVVDLTTVPDRVDASGVGVSYSTFYPVKDGYRDTLPIVGVRNEPASVLVRVYNAKNKLMKSFSVPSGSGAYKVLWTGRSSSGTMLPTGTYKVTQTLTDGAGIHLVVTRSVALSAKKLYYYTKTITKYASSLSTAGHTGAGRVIVYSDHSIKVDARSDWAGAGWQFTLPSATVYSSIVFGAYGYSGAPPGSIGVQDFRVCAYSSVWNVSCFNRWKSVGPSKTWYSVSMSPTYNRYGHAVRAVVSQYVGSTKVYKVRVVVKYGILR